ncbi:MAG: DNA-3-methyladenine glycosylase [Chitinophagaceae bacterium]|nr:DNA-3-methyladenine glycosylase [Chitinophagaceae bacterium]
MQKLGLEFYNRSNVVQIAKELPGKVLVTNFDGRLTSGRIVEVEAYNGVVDMASHARRGTRTARNEMMYARAGTAYVYICYGIHHLFNIVTNKVNIPHAILVRAVEPLEGIDVMLRRTGKKKPDSTLTSGPGNAGKALGIFNYHSGIDLTGDTIYLAEDGFKLGKGDVIATARIGVESAGDDAKLPYRFIVKGNPYVSGRKF